MPRSPRVVLPKVPLHIIQRGNNRQTCFFEDADRRFYLACLEKAAPASGCALHAYVLMSNHVHLLLTPDARHSAGDMMKRVSQRYAQYVNRTYDRSGTLWEGRFRSCIVHEEAYLLACYRYIELNPLRTGMVGDPADYRWSSYRANALGEADRLLTPHPIYAALAGRGRTAPEAYRALFDQELEGRLIEKLRRSTNANLVIGDRAFESWAASKLGRRVTPGKRGRPRRAHVPEPNK